MEQKEIKIRGSVSKSSFNIVTLSLPFLLAHRTNILIRDVATGRDKAQLTSVTVRTVMSQQMDLLVSMCIRYVI